METDEEEELPIESLGLTSVVLPFMLLFTVIFAMLQKAKIFGKDYSVKLQQK